MTPLRDRCLVKICGLTRVEPAIACVDAGADAIGVNLWSGSARRCAPDEARRIVEAIGDRARVVAVVVDEPLDALLRLREELGLEWIQLHGDEPAPVLEALLPSAMKALRVRGAIDRDVALAVPGDELLIDAHVEGLRGGSGVTADWSVAAAIARERRVWLAGGLTPENVEDAIRWVRPCGVDVASGVERAPGDKDLARVRAFIDAVRRVA